MNRPYIICPMTISLDGKVDVQKLQPITYGPHEPPLSSAEINECLGSV